jgi:hypothetical protein
LVLRPEGPEAGADGYVIRDEHHSFDDLRVSTDDQTTENQLKLETALTARSPSHVAISKGRNVLGVAWQGGKRRL